MGREVRMVPPGWQHPGGGRWGAKPLLPGPFSKRAAEWDEGFRQWELGFVQDWSTYPTMSWKPKSPEDKAYSYVEFAGEKPVAEDYMPEFAPGAATWLMMYETCTEGTPISPAFATPEELAQWLYHNGASAFGGQTASYESWLRVCNGGYAPSMIVENGVAKSGVEGIKE